MGCGEPTPVKDIVLDPSGKENELFIDFKKMDKIELAQQVPRIMEIKFTLEDMVNDIKGLNWPTLENVRQNNGIIKFGDFLAFFKFFGQEEYWNVPISRQSLEPVFSTRASEDGWDIELFVEYFQTLMSNIFNEMRTSAIEANLFICQFFLVPDQSPEKADRFMKKLEELKQNKDSLIKRMMSKPEFTPSDYQDLFSSVKLLAPYLSIDRLTDNYFTLIEFLFKFIDTDNNSKILKPEMEEFFDKVVSEASANFLQKQFHFF